MCLYSMYVSVCMCVCVETEWSGKAFLRKWCLNKTWMKWGPGLHGHVRKRIPGRGHSKGKGREVGACLVLWKGWIWLWVLEDALGCCGDVGSILEHQGPRHIMQCRTRVLAGLVPKWAHCWEEELALEGWVGWTLPGSQNYKADAVDSMGDGGIAQMRILGRWILQCGLWSGCLVQKFRLHFSAAIQWSKLLSPIRSFVNGPNTAIPLLELFWK